MNEFKLTEQIIFVPAYFVLSILIAVITMSGLSAWLGINVGFAVIPLILITFIYERLQKKEFAIDAITVIAFIGFVFFLPNTFYIITDFIHINSSEFETASEYVTTYKENISAYILLLHIAISMVIGLYTGVKSLFWTNEIFKKVLNSKWLINGLMVFLMFLSAIGIFIGRFLRLFSWDVLNPFNVISQLVDNMNIFGVQFIILFTFVQALLYYGYLLIKKRSL